MPALTETDLMDAPAITLATSSSFASGVQFLLLSYDAKRQDRMLLQSEPIL